MVKATNIQWDIDLEDRETYEDAIKALSLPKEIFIPTTIKTEDEISDYISELTGFCHRGFSLESEND